MDARTSALTASAPDVADIPEVDWTHWHAAHAKKTARLEQERHQLARLIDVEGRKASQARLLELRVKEWLTTHAPGIKTEVKRLALLDGIEAAIRLTSTNALTTKNNEIASAELAQGFCDRELWPNCGLFAAEGLKAEPENTALKTLAETADKKARGG